VKRQLALWSLLLITSLSFAGGEKLSRQNYIDQWKDEAMFQMVTHGIPASITLAQGILESGNGNSELAAKSNNHFGIKCHSDWTGKKSYHDDDKKGECFRVYETAHQSFEDHSTFLLRKRYESLFKLKATDYKGWARGLKRCGYATNPKYANLLIRLVEENDLARFDKQALKMKKSGEIPARNIDSKKRKKKNKKRKSKDTPVNDNPIEINTDNDVMIAKAGIRTHSIKMSTNRIKFCIAKEGDTFSSLSKELLLMPWQLPKYNELPPNAQLEEGQIIYLQPKRKKGNAHDHIMEDGDTLWSVSHTYGIKMKHLLKLNGIDGSASPPPGTKLRLR